MQIGEVVFDEENWSYEPSDYSVGIFGEAWVHETCKKEYDAGCTTDSRLRGLPTRNGVVYAEETTVVTCNDCAATTEFKDTVLIGFEGEPEV